MKSGLRILDTYIKQTETSRVKMELDTSKRSFRTKYNPIKSKHWRNPFRRNRVDFVCVLE